MTAHESLAVGIVVERRETGNQWQPLSWRPVAVLPHAAQVDSWVNVGHGDNWTRFHTATLSLELHTRETEGYRNNLSQEPPCVFVILREGEDDDEAEIETFHATVCPYEAMGYVESGDEIVEGVPMPAVIFDWVHAFVAQHHVEEPFRKRKNKAHRDQRGGTRPRGKFAPPDQSSGR